MNHSDHISGNESFMYTERISFYAKNFNKILNKHKEKLWEEGKNRLLILGELSKPGLPICRIKKIMKTDKTVPVSHTITLS
jgi:hypothetical protein